MLGSVFVSERAASMVIYIVRCNFTAPEREAAWNGWYSGPKIAQMLEKPHFQTCQRFRRASGAGRDYLALWTATSPEALTTREYRSQWGFADWQQYITDWSRDLFDGGERSSSDFAVEPGGALRVASFDGLSAEAAGAASRLNPDLMWLPVIGLDRHTPLIGLRPLPPAAPAEAARLGPQDAVYRPISEFHQRR
jgi:hypothetical protein